MNRGKHPKRISRDFCSLKTKMGEISFILVRSSARKTLSITIDEKADLNVSAPFKMGEKEIFDFVKHKIIWITEKIKEANKNKAILDKKVFNHGSQFLFLGKKYKISVFERKIKRGHVSFNPLEGWFVTIPYNLPIRERQIKIKEKMVQWYRLQAKEILGSRIFYYSRLMGVEPKKIAVRTQKQIWGCCNYHTQTINLNWQIILSPIKVIDYVVVHELCHLTVPSHSKRFWNKVEKFMPDFKSYKQWLKTNQLEMALP